MQRDDILAAVNRYYSRKVAAHGATPNGVDWNSRESQDLRFDKLMTVVADEAAFSINDYGCGYGALVERLRSRSADFRYRGFDVSAAMIDEAKRLHGDDARCSFVSDESRLLPADYAVASGIFNVKMQIATPDWEAYLFETLDRLAQLSTRGFAFNVLTLYSDPERRRADLYYADPCVLFDHCKRRFSRHVALLHDYELYEFTVVVRHDARRKP